MLQTDEVRLLDSSLSPTHSRKSLLLLEPSLVLRQTVASVARDLDIADIHQAMSFEAAEQFLGSQQFDGCVLAIGEEQREIELIRNLRAGGNRSGPETPVVVMTAECDIDMAVTLRELRVARILLKPFKVKTILETIVQIHESGRSPMPGGRDMLSPSILRAHHVEGAA